ncbi:MAG: hypothetical protein SH819_03220 [Cytophagales bacterium]|nr:hypothetical protein [Cytophagales bacterium]
MKSSLLTLLLGITLFAAAQPKDYSADVASPDAIIAALYEVISGPAGQARDWDRFRNLFSPDARLLPTRKNETGELVVRGMTPDEYVTAFSSRIPVGFYERELKRISESYGTVVQAFSTYETRDKVDGPVTNRGINSIQLFFDGKRYFVVNVFWCAESLGFPLPAKYLNP